MIEKLKKLVLKKYDFDLYEFKAYMPVITRSKFLIPSIVIFILILVEYYLQYIGVIDHYVDFIVVLFSFFLFVLVPIAQKKGNKYDILVITPELIIQQISKKDVVVIPFNNIKKFSVEDKVGMIIENIKKKIIIKPSVLGDDIVAFIDILEAKGKTFDKSKEYMHRPIEIMLVDEKLVLKDIKQEASSTDIILETYFRKYKMLTPGFLDDIIFMNSIVDKASREGTNLVLRLNQFEVKSGHPENVLFESQIATDCILIFEDAEILSTIKKAADGSSKEIAIVATIPSLNKNIQKSVISYWKSSPGSIEIQFSVGLHLVKTEFTFKEIVIGWNKFL